MSIRKTDNKIHFQPHSSHLGSQNNMERRFSPERDLIAPCTENWLRGFEAQRGRFAVVPDPG